MMTDPLTKATNKVLKAVVSFNTEVNRKKNLILDAQETIDAAQVAINEAKKSLLM